ncbi:MAG: RNA 2',3'-cyclic phosphodiesterase [Desulfonauticus sp.]|nr:RNA 2',3'-cyclic phosphodiesterase [Desulfonauticus sp.]
MRIFIGLPINEELTCFLARRLTPWKRKFRSHIVWVKPENYHFTLKFLGEAKTHQVEELKQQLKEKIKFFPFQLSINGVGFFVNKGAVRVIWLGVREMASFQDYFQQIESLCAKLGFLEESRPYHPHLTLGRVKSFWPNDPWLEFKQELNNCSWPILQLNKITLWQSQLHPSGAIYRPILEINSL